MKLHGNAALSWQGRRVLARRVVAEGWTLSAAAEAAGVSVRCARKWVCRYRMAGEQGLVDRSSAPCRVANRTPADRVEAIVKLRRLRFTAAEIAETLGMALSTVSGILTRIGMGRLGRLGLEPAVRYERSRPGELVHIDVKKLGRIQGGAGWRVRGGRQHYNSKYTDRPALSVTASARSTSTSPSTITAASPTQRCSPTRRRRPPPASSAAPSPSTAATASASRRSSATTAPPTSRRSTRSPVESSAQAPPHPALPTADKRQSRTVHPHHARRLGLRRHLRLKRRTHPRP